MRFLNSAVVLTLVLAGCNSFNTYDPTAKHQGSQLQTHKKADRGWFSSLFGSDDAASDVQEVINPPPPANPTVSVRDEDGKLLCPYEKWLVIPSVPVVPADQLRQLGPKDKDAIIQLLLDHIDVMHQYAQKVHDRGEAQRKHYANECKRWLMQHGQ
jgi:hypothetical protein